MKAASETIETLLKHRTIREFTDEKVPDEVLDTLKEVITRTATSTGLQTFSVIRVTCPERRKAIAEVCKQEYAARVPELFIFVADVYRNAMIAAEQGCDLPSARDMDRFFQAYTDAVLAAQNLTAAVESLGMGAVFFGSILNDPAKIIEILEMPELTMPVVGVGFGVPNQEPQLKPRMPAELKFFENAYKKFDAYLPEIAGYDETMRMYYDLREKGKRSDDFSKQVVKRLESPIAKRSEVLKVVRAQGFDLLVVSD